MKREIAIRKAVDALGVHPLPANNDHILAMADVLQRECDLREGLIEMASSIITDAVSGYVNAVAISRWKEDYERILNNEVSDGSPDNPKGSNAN